jgi:hypothetical protein
MVAAEVIVHMRFNEARPGTNRGGGAILRS